MHAVSLHQFCGGWQLRRLEVVQRGAERQLQVVVCALGRVDDDLARNHRVFGEQEQRLFGREVPVMAEAVAAIARAELPERRIPRRAIARPCTRARRDPPAFGHRLEKTIGDEPLSVSTGQLARIDDPVTGLLQPLQGGQ